MDDLFLNRMLSEADKTREDIVKKKLESIFNEFKLIQRPY